jgi:hypothetical protein
MLRTLAKLRSTTLVINSNFKNLQLFVVVILLTVVPHISDFKKL